MRITITLLLTIIIALGLFTYLNYNVSNEGKYKPAGGAPIIVLAAPPKIALADPKQNIPPLNTSKVFIVAYYNAGKEINLTKAAELHGLIIDKWGGAYFDATYYLIDPPSSNSVIKVHLRVRSDGWVLAWISKDEDLTDIVMIGIPLYELSDYDPWIAYNITTLSYTIYKVLKQAGVISNKQNQQPGPGPGPGQGSSEYKPPKELTKLSNHVGYYDYKYCGSEGKEGFLAVVGIKTVRRGGPGSQGRTTREFDFVVGRDYEVKESKVLIVTRMYLINLDGMLKVFYGTNSLNTIYSCECPPDHACLFKDSESINVSPGTIYHLRTKWYDECNYISPNEECMSVVLVVMVGVLK